ncbi:hypothetical protein VNO77_17657 [Canavalia gladiata]|uniref:Uncharacterized protein n=1 Tax=Canavalia gladiata TaxID=3824 RepID=A0AAN9QMX0_CANGL
MRYLKVLSLQDGYTSMEQDVSGPFFCSTSSALCLAGTLHCSFHYIVMFIRRQTTETLFLGNLMFNAGWLGALSHMHEANRSVFSTSSLSLLGVVSF